MAFVTQSWMYTHLPVYRHLDVKTLCFLFSYDYISSLIKLHFLHGLCVVHDAVWRRYASRFSTASYTELDSVSVWLVSGRFVIVTLRADFILLSMCTCKYIHATDRVTMLIFFQCILYFRQIEYLGKYFQNERRKFT